LTTGDYINAALLVVTAIGVFAVFWQIRSAARSQRASFLKELYGDLRTEPAASEAFYQIEYGKFRYSGDFHGSDLEPKIDSLLTQLDLICELHLRGVLSRNEMGFFDYEIARVARDNEIKKYLEFLRHFYAEHDLERKPFASLQKYAASRSRNVQRGATR
jgi:hypothetical protein